MGGTRAVPAQREDFIPRIGAGPPARIARPDTALSPASGSPPCGLSLGSAARNPRRASRSIVTLFFFQPPETSRRLLSHGVCFFQSVPEVHFTAAPARRMDKADATAFRCYLSAVQHLEYASASSLEE
jgi:hypothetical protein